MRLRHIEIFHAIYTTCSITNAAKILHVSQPSVSKVLSHAEMQLGFKLFERVKGRLVPTEEAEMMFGEVDKIYQQLHSIKNTAKNIKKSEFGSLRLAVTPALGFDAIPRVLANYIKDYPNINIDIQTIHNDAVMQSLLEHKCDLAIVLSPPTLPGLTITPLTQSELVIVYPKSLFPEQPNTLSLADIADLDTIDIRDSGPLAEKLWVKVMQDDVNLTSSIKVQTYFIAVRLVSYGMGICIVDKHTAMGNLNDNIAFASFEEPIYFDISAVHLENQTKTKVMDEFIPYLTL